jgi:hypothetical protein
MKNITRFNMIYSGVAVIVILTAVTVITADGTASKKSTCEQRIEKIMADCVQAIQAIENSYDTKMTPRIKSARTIRDGAIAKVGKAMQAKLEYAAKNAKRRGQLDEAKLAEEEIAEFAKLIKMAQATDPRKPEVADTVEEKVVEPEPLASHVTLNGHAYLAIMGEHTVFEAMALCKRIGGRLASIESVEELVFIMKELPVKHTLWIGAHDVEHRGRWRWLTGVAVNRVCWAKKQPAFPKRDNRTGDWSNTRAALKDDGMHTRSAKDRCRGFICEWGR